MKGSILAVVAMILISASCVVNPDADEALRDEQRTSDSVSDVEQGVQPLPVDTGQHSMPVAPVAPGEMPVVNPADTAVHQPL